MFGKGGTPLSIWIKEFCELVFIQTIQAFLFAISISMIMQISIANVINTTDRNVSLGIICIVVLTSIFKVEDIVRKIFGFGPTKADHGRALASLAKTKMAFDVGKRIFDNGKKVLGGAGRVGKGMLKTAKDSLDEKNEMQANKDNYKKKLDLLKASNAKPSDEGAKKTRSEKASNLDQQILERKRRAERLAHQYNQKGLSKKKRDELKREMTENDAHISRLEEERAKFGNATDASDSASSSSKTSDAKRVAEMMDLQEKYNAKKKEIEDKYKEKKKARSNMRREGRRMIAKGVLETGGAVIGGTAGMIIGGADGNIDEALRGGVAGMGIGDAIAEGAVNLTTAPIDFGRELNEGLDETRESYAKTVSRFEKDYEKMLSGVYKDLDDAQKSALKHAVSKSARSKAKLSVVPDIDIDINMKNVNQAIQRANKTLKMKGEKEISKLSRSVDDIGN